MKVDNNVTVRTSAVRSGRATGTGGARFSTQLSAGAQPPAMSGGAPINGASAVMALQEVADRGEGRRRATHRGIRLLDLLDDLRAGLLGGGLSGGTLTELSRLAGQARDTVDTPELQDVLDQIDLRAQVELAKLDAAR